MLSAKKSALKENLKVESKYVAFYTGGNVEWTKCGNYLYCQCGQSVKVLNIENGKVEKSFDLGEEEEVTSFALSADDQNLVVSSRNGLLKQWDLEDDTIKRTWKSFHNGPVSYMTFDNTSCLLASGGCDATIKVWDVIRQYCTHNLRGAQGVFSIVKFHPESEKTLIFGAADDTKIHVWNLLKSNIVASLEGHFSVITELVFLNGNEQMLSSCRDKVVILWDLNTYSSLKTIPVFESLESIILVPKEKTSLPLNRKSQGTHFITAGSKGILKIWDTSTASCVYAQDNSIITPPDSSEQDFPLITRALYNSDQNSIAVISYEQNIILHKMEDFNIKKQFVGYNDDILDIKVFGPEEKYIAVATNSPHIKVFEIETFNCQLLKAHLDVVLALDTFPKDPSMLASSSKDNTVKIWKLNETTSKMECIFTGSGHTHGVGAISCSRLSSEFVVSGSQDTTLKVWDIPKEIHLVAMKPYRGMTLAIRCTEKVHEKDINSISVSPNDQLIATGSQDKLAKLWSSKDLSLLGVMRGHSRSIWCVQFSPVDQVLASSSADCTVKIWSLSDYSCLQTFEGHECSVLKVMFVCYGMQLLTSAADGNVKLWTIKLNECVKTFDGHEDKIWALATNSKEDYIFSGGADSALIVWKDCTNEDRQEQLTNQENIILQEQELSNLVQQKKWLKALGLAITLEQPFRARSIIEEILLEVGGKQKLENSLKGLREDQIDCILRFAVTWNTNSKHSSAAQTTLNIILKLYSPEQLLKFPNMRANLEGLLPYTERHLQRLNKLQQQAMFLDYLWCNMKLTGLETR